MMRSCVICILLGLVLITPELLFGLHLLSEYTRVVSVTRYLGQDVRIAIVDVGADIKHPDLCHCVDTNRSYNFVEANQDVSPKKFQNYIEMEELTDHGNAMACLIAGQQNGQCSAGVVPDSTLVVLKAFEYDEPRLMREPFLSLKHLGAALSYQNDHIDIYSCSFSAVRPFADLGEDIFKALEVGARQGRQDKGNIYVVPAGDNGRDVYDCNLDPLANSMYTLTIARAEVDGSTPHYAIPCVNTVTTVKIGENSDKIMTTCSHRSECQEVPDGVSAATAIAAGVSGQALQANPKLTQRDVLYIMVRSSSFDGLVENSETSVNGAGLKYHSYFGFGLLNNTKLVMTSLQWTNIPPVVTWQIKKWVVKEQQMNFKNIQLKQESDFIASLEHVEVDTDIATNNIHVTKIVLISPMGTKSPLLHAHPKPSRERRMARNWIFRTVQFWGERPDGMWTLMIQQNTTRNGYFDINHLSVTLHGLRRH